MALRRPKLFFVFLFTLAVAGCGKKSASTAKTPVETPPSEKVEITAEACETGEVKAILDGITRAESDKNALDLVAKKAPEKGNWRRVYEMELAFLKDSESSLRRLKTCGAPTSVLEGVGAKIAKSQANVTYLRESFPDFK